MKPIPDKAFESPWMEVRRAAEEVVRASPKFQKATNKVAKRMLRAGEGALRETKKPSESEPKDETDRVVYSGEHQESTGDPFGFKIANMIRQERGKEKRRKRKKRRKKLSESLVMQLQKQRLGGP